METLVFLLLAIGSVAANLGEYAPTIELAKGKLRGVIQETDDGSKVDAYIGIRYGRAERFAKPKPVESWAPHLYNATNWQFACPQQSVPYGTQVKHVTALKATVANEDCLFINLWRPVEEKANRSVMVWVHGGGFTEGTIFSVYYDGRYLASMGDVIVVTVNYRLDAFGFYYGDPEEAPGNQGLYDQILALKWVQENIAKFGGNPHSVTLFGESAGSFSTSALYLSPLAKGLFKRAIMQSGATNSWLGSQSVPKSTEVGVNFAESLKCSDPSHAKVLACLRSKSVPEILEATKHALQNGESYIPVYGGELMPLPPVTALKTGHFNKDVDLMYGITKNEGSMFVVEIFNIPFLDPTHNNTDYDVAKVRAFIGFMMTLFNDKKPDEVAEYYTRHLKEDDKVELKRAISYAFGDYHLVCPTMLFGETVAKHAPHNKYYSYRLMKRTQTPVMFCSGWMGICHGEDVVFMFGIPQRLLGTAFSDSEAKLAREMIHAWTSFAKTGNPGKMGEVTWGEAVDRSNLGGPTRLIELGDSFRMVDNLFKETCDAFWKPRIFV